MNHRSSRGLLATLFRTLALAAIATAVLAADSPPQAPSGSGDKSPAVAAVPAPPPFGFEQVVERAKDLVAAPYKDPRGGVPDWLLDITYDQWRDIRFRPDRALWRDKKSAASRCSSSIPGLYYDRTVDDQRGRRAAASQPVAVLAEPVRLRQERLREPRAAGPRLRRLPRPLPDQEAGLPRRGHRLPRRDLLPRRRQGSGLRPLGARPRDRHGACRRARSFRTSASSGWCDRPHGARSSTIYALLDSPRVTGAYRFVVQPGEQTRRRRRERGSSCASEIAKLGIAPLTSMFFHGENTPRHFDDFRPEVHDSDGLLLNFAHRRVAVAAARQPARRLEISAFRMPTTRTGFGLLQRDRDFDHYQDLETRWPSSGRASGSCRRATGATAASSWSRSRRTTTSTTTSSSTGCPTSSRSRARMRASATRCHWYGDDPDRPPGGRVVATRRDAGHDRGRVRASSSTSRARSSSALPADEVLRGVVTVAGGDDGGEIARPARGARTRATGGWRLTFQIAPEEATSRSSCGPICDQGGEALTETWSYCCHPVSHGGGRTAGGGAAETCAHRGSPFGRPGCCRIGEARTSAPARYLAALGRRDDGDVRRLAADAVPTRGSRAWERGSTAMRATLAALRGSSQRDRARGDAVRARSSHWRLRASSSRVRRRRVDCPGACGDACPCDRRPMRSRADRAAVPGATCDGDLRRATPRPRAVRAAALRRRSARACPWTRVAHRRRACCSCSSCWFPTRHRQRLHGERAAAPAAARGSRWRSSSSSARSSAGSRSGSGPRCSASARSSRGAIASRSRGPGGRRPAEPASTTTASPHRDRHADLRTSRSTRVFAGLRAHPPLARAHRRASTGSTSSC